MSAACTGQGVLGLGWQRTLSHRIPCLVFCHLSGCSSRLLPLRCMRCQRVQTQFFELREVAATASLRSPQHSHCRPIATGPTSPTHPSHRRLASPVRSSMVAAWLFNLHGGAAQTATAYSPMAGNSPSYARRRGASRWKAGFAISAMLVAAFLLNNGTLVAENPALVEWTLKGCPLKILDLTTTMEATYQVRQRGDGGAATRAAAGCGLGGSQCVP